MSSQMKLYKILFFSFRFIKISFQRHESLPYFGLTWWSYLKWIHNFILLLRDFYYRPRENTTQVSYFTFRSFYLRDVSIYIQFNAI